MFTLIDLFRQRIVTLAILIGTCTLPLEAQVTTEVLWQRCFGGSDFEQGFRVHETGDGGFVCVGYGGSVDGDLAASHGGQEILVTKLSIDGAVQWSRVLGGSSDDAAFELMVASDGAILVVGYTYSNDGDVTVNHGQADIWVVKLSPLGSTLWERSYGGSDTETLGQIVETTDGGFLIHASTGSADGDVVGFHPGIGFDNWVFKISSAGSLEWSRALGGSGHEGGGQLFLAADGGAFVNFSLTESNDGDVSNYHGGGDCLLVKLSSTGSVEWSRTIGGSLGEVGSNAVELSNGDILVLGTTYSNDGDVALNHGGSDVLLARLNSNGVLLWARTYGGSLNDYGQRVVPTSDGGFFLACASTSNDGDVANSRGGGDAWIFKVDANGLLLWQRSIGGSSGESTDLIEDADGGYLLWGATASVDGDVSGNHGGIEYWMVKLSADGNVRWQRCLGGANDDTMKWIIRASDGMYVAFGFTESINGDVTGNHGGRDMWVVKLKVTEPIEPPDCALYIPNAFSPNDSGKNDAQCLYGTDCIRSMSFTIYDRWGNKVFESTDPHVCWNGTFNDQPLDPAVFVYHLSATLNDGNSVERQGNIMLMR